MSKNGNLNSEQTKLFASPKIAEEHAAALWREKEFQKKYGALRDHWYGLLFEEGMPTDQVLDQFGRKDLPKRHSPDEDTYWAHARHWYYIATDYDFQTHPAKDNSKINREIWRCHANGATEAELQEQFGIRNIHDKIETLRSRFVKALIDGSFFLQDQDYIDWQHMATASVSEKNTVQLKNLRVESRKFPTSNEVRKIKLNIEKIESLQKAYGPNWENYQPYTPSIRKRKNKSTSLKTT